MILAVIAVFTAGLFYLSIPLAATALILALLSRGRGSISGRSKLAVIVASTAIVLSGISTVYSVYTVMTTPQLRSQLEDMFDYFYDFYGGEDFRSDTPDPFMEPYQNDTPYQNNEPYQIPEEGPQTIPYQIPEYNSPSGNEPQWVMRGGVKA